MAFFHFNATEAKQADFLNNSALQPIPFDAHPEISKNINSQNNTDNLNGGVPIKTNGQNVNSCVGADCISAKPASYFSGFNWFLPLSILLFIIVVFIFLKQKKRIK